MLITVDSGTNRAPIQCTWVSCRPGGRFCDLLDDQPRGHLTDSCVTQNGKLSATFLLHQMMHCAPKLCRRLT